LEVEGWLALFHPSRYESVRSVWQSPAGRQHPSLIGRDAKGAIKKHPSALKEAFQAGQKLAAG